MSIQVIYDANSQLITVDGLTNVVDGAYVNDAACTVEFLDAADQQLPGETWPVTLAYVLASDGKYQGMVSAAVSYTVGNPITAHIRADAGAGLVGDWSIPCRVVTRES